MDKLDKLIHIDPIVLRCDLMSNSRAVGVDWAISRTFGYHKKNELFEKKNCKVLVNGKNL